MQLILAIDSDPRRSEQLASVVRARLRVDLVQAKGAGEGLQALKDRIPDLILTAPLLSPFDDGVLDEYLRDLGAAGAHVQTVRIPVLSAGPKKKALATKLFSMGRKKSTSPAAPDGCDPKVFADEIATYLSRAADARQSVIHLTEAPPHEDEAPRSPVAVDTPVMSETLVEEFTYAYTSAVDATPARPTNIEATEPSYTEPSYTEPSYIEPSYAEVAEPLHNMASEPWNVEVTESSDVDDALNKPTPIVETMSDADQPTAPEPDRQAPSTSASFEAALAAIRAAWVKPDAPATATSSVTAAKPRTASQGDVDLTNAIDALEHVSDNPSTPPAKRQSDRPKTRPEKVPGPKMGASDGRSQDVWGVYDSDRREFSTLVDKLDEVTGPEEAPNRPGGILFR
jgi:hypothetical protein